MVWVPDPQSGSDAPVLEQSDVELRVNRLNTRAFIDADPIDIRLNYSAKERSPGGGWTRGAVQVRPEQRFKLIMQSPAGGSLDVNSSEDGTQYSVDHVLLGEYNAVIRPGDWWDDDWGNRWEISP